MMRIVVDTNVLVSGILFGGRPAELIRFVLMHAVSAVATQEIIEEYQSTLDYLLEKYGGRKVSIPLDIICSAMEIIPVQSRVKVCRDPDDDKFISCAVDGGCVFIVSGDKDLLSLERYADVEILTVAQFLDRLQKPPVA